MFFSTLLGDVRDKNIEFIGLLTKSLQFNKNYLTIVPSIIFLVFSMSAIHRVTHKNAPRFRRTTYRDALYREIAFQWTYLYVTRSWLYVVKGIRLTTTYLEQSVLKADGSETNVYCVHVLMFIVFILLSIVPFLLTITILPSDEAMDQNILFWIPPNRWTRSELGSAGRLMERPPGFIFTSTRMPHAYETKRSVSTENTKTSSSVEIIRYCKSGCIPEQVSSLDDIISDE